LSYAGESTENRRTRENINRLEEMVAYQNSEIKKLLSESASALRKIHELQTDNKRLYETNQDYEKRINTPTSQIINHAAAAPIVKEDKEKVTENSHLKVESEKSQPKASIYNPSTMRWSDDKSSLSESSPNTSNRSGPENYGTYQSESHYTYRPSSINEAEKGLTHSYSGLNSERYSTLAKNLKSLVEILNLGLHNLAPEGNLYRDYLILVRDACKDLSELKIDSAQSKIDLVRNKIVVNVGEEERWKRALQSVTDKYDKLAQEAKMTNSKVDMKIFETFIVKVKEQIGLASGSYSGKIEDESIVSAYSKLTVAETLMTSIEMVMNEISFLQRAKRLREMGFHEPINL
jgi:hypothetical protein